MSKSILYFSQYFFPETGAASVRVTELTKYLKTYGRDVTVICPLENYPDGRLKKNDRFKFFKKEVINEVLVYRVRVLAFGRSKAIHHYLLYLSFVVSSFFCALFLSKRDIVVSTSPPLFVGIPGFLISVLKKSEFFLEVRDLWPESVKIVKKLDEKSHTIRIGEALERFLYLKAHKLIVVTQGFKSHIEKIVGKKNIVYIPNGEDIEDLKLPERSESLCKKLNIMPGVPVLGYYGIMGESQDLERFVYFAKKMPNEIQMLFVGFGSHFEKIRGIIAREKIENFILIDKVPRNELNEYYAICDIFLVNLKDELLFKKTIPSKVFVGLAIAKPILLGVDGEARSLVENSGAGKFFDNKDFLSFKKALNDIIYDLDFQRRALYAGPELINREFSRKKLSEKLNLHLS